MWFCFFGVVQKLLTYDPFQRISAKDALEDVYFDDVQFVPHVPLPGPPGGKHGMI